MTKGRPFLVAETPRAGRWNGCLIVPAGSGIVPAAVARYFEDAREGGRGADYLAASREVAQPSTGRVGHETLLLAGVDVGALGARRTEEIRRAMRALLDPLEELVVRTIRWDERPQASIVERPELSLWLERLGDLGSRREPSHRRASAAWVAMAAVLLAVLAQGTARFFPPGRRSSGPPRPNLLKTAPNSEGKGLEDAANIWLDELRRTNPGRPPTRPDAKVGSLTMELEARRAAGADPRAGDAKVESLTKELEDRLWLSGGDGSRRDGPRSRLLGLLREIIRSDASFGEAPGERERRSERDLLALLEDVKVRGVVIGLSDRIRQDPDHPACGFFRPNEPPDEAIANLFGPDVGRFRRVEQRALELVGQLEKHRGTGATSEDPLLKELLGSIRPDDAERDALARAAVSRWKFYTPDDARGMVLIGRVCDCVVDGYADVTGRPGGGDVPHRSRTKLGRFRDILPLIRVSYNSADRPGKEIYAALKELAEAIPKDPVPD